MVAVVVIPLAVGLLYAKFLLMKLQRRITSANQLQDESTNDTVPETISGMNFASFSQSRLSDMKTNAVVRLWWKKQQRIHGVSIDNDIESQVRRPATIQTPQKPTASTKRESTPKHKKHSKDKDALKEKKKKSDTASEEDKKKEKKKKLDTDDERRQNKKEKKKKKHDDHRDAV